eukprot:CAMPEP_0204338752 /NCGR_PEP_ID=MMETSP0469-20131031/21296_1 /ASSEMBLY_ACC=CAM_ASM_000384 /TAXON_ID=2969 /ORGANISM="Oxyrrhis marina" /LENGTH=400 /DNA_ID=CAMNT_0051322993 /DNA_START=63 /DNA_END=1262 /DNA_ORIENTATION=+
MASPRSSQSATAGTMEGFVEKRAQFLRMWKQRYMRQDDVVIKYWKALPKEGEEPRGTISLQGGQVIAENDVRLYLVLSDSTVEEIKAKDRQTRDEWLLRLNLALRRYKISQASTVCLFAKPFLETKGLWSKLYGAAGDDILRHVHFGVALRRTRVNFKQRWPFRLRKGDHSGFADSWLLLVSSRVVFNEKGGGDFRLHSKWGQPEPKKAAKPDKEADKTKGARPVPEVPFPADDFLPEHLCELPHNMRFETLYCFESSNNKEKFVDQFPIAGAEVHKWSSGDGYGIKLVRFEGDQSIEWILVFDSFTAAQGWFDALVTSQAAMAARMQGIGIYTSMEILQCRQDIGDRAWKESKLASWRNALLNLPGVSLPKGSSDQNLGLVMEAVCRSSVQLVDLCRTC